MIRQLFRIEIEEDLLHIEYVPMKRNTSPKTLIYLIPSDEIQWENPSQCKRHIKFGNLSSCVKTSALSVYILFIALYTCLYFMIQAHFFPAS